MIKFNYGLNSYTSAIIALCGFLFTRKHKRYKNFVMNVSFAGV